MDKPITIWQLFGHATIYPAPMIADSIKFKGHPCFKNHWAGFDCFKRINVIIGRNNAGKSQLIDLVQTLTTKGIAEPFWPIACEGTLDRKSLKEAISAKQVPWQVYGNPLVDQRVAWKRLETNAPATDVTLLGNVTWQEGLANDPSGRNVAKARNDLASDLCRSAVSPIASRVFRRLRAERNILKEEPYDQPTLEPDGSGATRMLEHLLNAREREPLRHLVERELLDALNHVFQGHGPFARIDVTREGSLWEIVLAEERKGRVPLGSSGSGLKTVLLVLLNLLVVPKVEKTERPLSEYVFAFEELENNLHPALFRRLLRFIEGYALREKCMVFLATHSNIALDLFGTVDHAQVIHVTHDGESAKTETVSTYFGKQTVVTELGAKPSDLLQANGVIWVEGPSDRIHLNRWIELASDGKLREGRDYQCAFFGGSLLAQQRFTGPDDGTSDLADLLRLNANIIVVCDSDKTAESGDGSELKSRVTRIRDEVTKAGGLCWITHAKEIENYPPLTALQKVVPEATRAPDKFERFFPSESAAADGGASFLKDVLKRKTWDKVERAMELAPHMNKADMETRFDWKEQLSAIVAQIEKWNA